MRDKGESAFDDVVNNDSDTDNSEKTDADADTGKQDVSTGTDGKPDTETSSNSTPTGKKADPRETEQGDSTRDADTLSNSVPAFPYSDVTQRPVYAQENTWKNVEDLKYYADGELREQFNVRNAETREFDEALALLISEEISAEQIAAKVVEIRGFDSSNPE